MIPDVGSEDVDKNRQTVQPTELDRKFHKFTERIKQKELRRQEPQEYEDKST